MNSFTGVGHADGTKTGKVIAYATRSKRCTTGYTAELLKKIKKKSRQRNMIEEQGLEVKQVY